MGLCPPTFISGGPCPPFFCLNIVSLSNTISIGSSDKVNRLMKKTLQNFGSILSILFLTYCNLAGFHNCLADYTVHSLSPCYGLLTVFVLLSSAARCWNTIQFWCHFTCLCAWASEGIFSRGATSGFYKCFSTGGQKWWNLVLSLEIENSIFAEIFKFLLLFRHPCHTIKKFGLFQVF